MQNNPNNTNNLNFNITNNLRLYKLTDYLESNNLLYPNQYGFRQKCSTEHAILHLTHRIISEMDQCKTPITFFLDLSKAFDTLDTEILIQKQK